MKSTLHKIAHLALTTPEFLRPLTWEAEDRKLSAIVTVSRQNWDYRQDPINDIQYDGIGKNLNGWVSAYSLLLCVDGAPTALMIWPQFEIAWDHGTFDPVLNVSEITIIDKERWEWLRDNRPFIAP